MQITLDQSDIANLKSIRDENSNEIAFLISNDEILTFEGSCDCATIPIGNWIIGHTHPANELYKYNPPSKIDIIAAIEIPHQDWIIIDSIGIWIYRFNIDNPDHETIAYITNRFDIAAIGIMNGLLALDEYLNSINQCVIINQQTQGVNIQFLPYSTTTHIELKQKKIS